MCLEVPRTIIGVILLILLSVVQSQAGSQGSRWNACAGYSSISDELCGRTFTDTEHPFSLTQRIHRSGLAVA